MAKNEKHYIFPCNTTTPPLRGGGGEEILKRATHFYQNLFGPSDSPTTHLDTNCWSTREVVDSHENEQLTSQFSEEEIKFFVMTMEKNTNPSHGHMPVEFFQTCWNIIKEDIMTLFSNFFNHNLDIWRLNYGMITLPPKTTNANRIQQYRPICLLNVFYNIFTKSMMLRVEHILNLKHLS